VRTLVAGMIIAMLASTACAQDASSLQNTDQKAANKARQKAADEACCAKEDSRLQREVLSVAQRTSGLRVGPRPMRGLSYASHEAAQILVQQFALSWRLQLAEVCDRVPLNVAT
jgi:hypothetical protein